MMTAVHAELGTMTGINVNESADTCGQVVDQCIAIADCILDRRTAAPWPPAEKVIRVFATSTVTGLESCGEEIAHRWPCHMTAEHALMRSAALGACRTPA
jgi:hypothetical protein